jgi:hypothetical protein
MDGWMDGWVGGWVGRRMEIISGLSTDEYGLIGKSYLILSLKLY